MKECVAKLGENMYGSSGLLGVEEVTEAGAAMNDECVRRNLG
jgi:hypothetical protein